MSGKNINLVSYMYIWKEIHLTFLAFESTGASAITSNQNMPYKIFIPITVLHNGKFASHFTETPPSLRWDLT